MKILKPALAILAIGLSLTGLAHAEPWQGGFNRGGPRGDFLNTGGSRDFGRGGDFNRGGDRWGRGGDDRRDDGRGFPGRGQPGVNRICFFDQPYFRGNSFCMNPGQNIDNLVPSGWNDRIRSFSIEGYVEAVLWNDVGPHGANINVKESCPDLQNLKLYWGVSAIQVLAGPANPFPGNNGRGDDRRDDRRDDGRGGFPGRGDDGRGGDFGRRQDPNPRICFFDQPNFRGNTFCMKPGESIANLVPSGWNDRIQSFQIFGYVEAVLWNDVGPHGANINVKDSVSDLRQQLNLYWGVSAIQVLANPSNPMGR